MCKLMSLDFHTRDDTLRNSPLFQLPFDDYVSLTSSFEEFQRITGVFVDPYGTTNMTTSHLMILGELVSKQHRSFSNFLKECGLKECELVVEGD